MLLPGKEVWMKQVQISQELFVQLLHYHLMEDDSNANEIRIGLEKKLDTEREKARQEYLDRRGIPDIFRW